MCVCVCVCECVWACVYANVCNPTLSGLYSFIPTYPALTPAVCADLTGNSSVFLGPKNGVEGKEGRGRSWGGGWGEC